MASQTLFGDYERFLGAKPFTLEEVHCEFEKLNDAAIYSLSAGHWHGPIPQT